MRLIDSDKIPWEYSGIFVKEKDGSSTHCMTFIVTREDVNKMPALEVYDGKIIEYERAIPISFIEKEMNELYEHIKGSSELYEKRWINFSIYVLNVLIAEWRNAHNGQQ